MGSFPKKFGAPRVLEVVHACKTIICAGLKMSFSPFEFKIYSPKILVK